MTDNVEFDDSFSMDLETGELTPRPELGEPPEDFPELDPPKFEAEAEDGEAGPEALELSGEAAGDDGATDSPAAGRIDWQAPFWVTIYQTPARTFTDIYRGENAEREAREFASRRATSSGAPVAVMGPQVDVYAVPQEIRALPMRLAFREVKRGVHAEKIAPDDWITCDGSPLSHVDYAGLYDAISTTSGEVEP